MDSLEEKIAYSFRDPDLLDQALTHPSLGYELKRSQSDNQRLEYLGDAVLQLILTEELFRMFPDFAEGRLTKLRARLVSRGALEDFAIGLDLGSHLKLGRGEAATGGRERSSNLADAFEALVGAIYLDGGLDAARRLVLEQCSSAIDRIAHEPLEVNPKGHLQEVLQAIDSTSPGYRVVDQSGPDHERTFVVIVEWRDQELGRGEGSSKKEAEIAAAEAALESGVWNKPSTGCE